MAGSVAPMLSGPHRRSAPVPGVWDDLVVMCAANSWDTIRFQDRHLAEHLSRWVPVLYVDPPLSQVRARRQPELAASLEGPRLRLVASSLARLTPVVPPGPERPGMARVTRALLRRAVRQATDSLGGSVRAVVATSPLVHALGACGERVKVFWAQDDMVAGAPLFGVSAERIRRGEERLACRADLIVAANPSVAAAWRARGYDPQLIPFGCDDVLFASSDEAPIPADVDLPRPVAGFVGHLSDRIDIPLLEAVAERDCSVLLIGPIHPMFDMTRLRRLLDRPNVAWVGAKEFEELPSYQRMIDVGLVPYTDSPFNLGSFPLKTLEYLAAGRPVVSTDLPAIRWLASEDVTVATGPEDFADAVIAATDGLRTPEDVARRREFAGRHSWSRRAQDFAAVLGIDVAKVRSQASSG